MLKFADIEKWHKTQHRESYNFIVFCGDVTLAVIDAIRHPFRIRGRETLYYLEQCLHRGQYLY